MKKIICKKEYDTETSALVKKVCVGEFGDPNGYEESLYETADGAFFTYGMGGDASPYPEETIKRMSKANAEKWIEANM